jgi:hypothetical protein
MMTLHPTKDMMKSGENATNRCKMLQPFLKIGRTLFLEGHEALPCTGPSRLRYFLLRQNSTVDNQLMQGYLGDIG